MVLNLTLIKETMEEVLILTPITLHQSRALLKNPRLPQNIPKSLQITKDCFVAESVVFVIYAVLLQGQFCRSSIIANTYLQ